MKTFKQLAIIEAIDNGTDITTTNDLHEHKLINLPKVELFL